MSASADRWVLLAGSQVRPPCHACAFFNSEDEEYEALLPFIREGFDRRDKSFHIIGEQRRDSYRQRLTGCGIDVPCAEVSGQLEIRNWENAHLKPGWFDQHAMLELVNGVLSDAKTKGYEHTRWVADMGWALTENRGVEHLAEYCARLNHVVADHQATIICTYDLRRFSAAQIIDVMRSHPLTIIGGLVQENPYYVPPDDLIEEFQNSRS